MIQWARRGNQQKWSGRLRIVMALLLLVLLAYVIAQTAWILWYGPSDALPPSSLQQVRTAAGDNGGRQLSQSQVEGWQLFGLYQQEAQNNNDRPVDAPDTRLKLELLGLFQTRDRDKSSAIIAEKGKDAELYHIGDGIPGNAKIDEIYADRVILRRQGRLETLRLNELSALGGVTQVTEPAPREPSPSPQTDLSQQRSAVIRQLGLKPVSEGETQGYQIGAQAPKQLIEQVGLNQGDVIVSVNGYPLGTEDSDLAAMQSYQDTQAASIVVQRGDQQFTVNYPP
ncbi:type II secretion system protein GspC [Alloalcanivorax mobilis]|uniref:type II secretion system protein GspC n=1 Tax=Alloalcanivorax mobilis TaxID=2019569 RepID=UPI000B5B2BAA|nr:type II secretion system protein GspC [Alloalcanivorax mobilis]ASK36529.1 type II secretion system protein GspC [Alcanivorax sp. N3-2A]